MEKASIVDYRPFKVLEVNFKEEVVLGGKTKKNVYLLTLRGKVASSQKMRLFTLSITEPILKKLKENEPKLDITKVAHTAVMLPIEQHIKNVTGWTEKGKDGKVTEFLHQEDSLYPSAYGKWTIDVTESYEKSDFTEETAYINAAVSVDLMEARMDKVVALKTKYKENFEEVLAVAQALKSVL